MLGRTPPWAMVTPAIVIPDGELEVTGDDHGLHIVTESVTGQVEDLGGEVLHDGGQINGALLFPVATLLHLKQTQQSVIGSAFLNRSTNFKGECSFGSDNINFLTNTGNSNS